ncbi:ribonuclease H-like domain-containing protein [Clostridium sp. KNHs214]|uniref:ribonuclease H-like domain-containing protein n=1 Tax=Clostridium sp. KNHs214 TaxID=1540257 RepID=UPI0005520A48|nr:ribonuclease H-like domain-containing protein [Clostridium sp. KNHs214]
MIIREYESKVHINKSILARYSMLDMCYYDIETTGFDKDKDCIMLISLGYFTGNDSFKIKQYFAEQLSEENNILVKFKEEAEKFNRWCSYNGIAFDEPFITNRMDKYFINFKVPIYHIDLYRIIRPYYEQLGINRCNLKTVEKFVGIQRKDSITGEESVHMYNRFLNTGNEKIRDIILLHNYEDVLDLPYLFNLVYRIDEDTSLIRNNLVNSRQIDYLKFLLNKNEISIDCNFHRMKKKQAYKIINMLNNGKVDKKDIFNILNNIY